MLVWLLIVFAFTDYGWFVWFGFMVVANCCCFWFNCRGGWSGVSGSSGVCYLLYCGFGLRCFWLFMFAYVVVGGYVPGCFSGVFAFWVWLKVGGSVVSGFGWIIWFGLPLV